MISNISYRYFRDLLFMREMLNMKTWTTIIFFLFLLVSIIGEKIKRRGTDSNNKPTEPLQGVFLLLFVKQFRAVVNYFLYSLLCYFTLKCKSTTVHHSLSVSLLYTVTYYRNSLVFHLLDWNIDKVGSQISPNINWESRSLFTFLGVFRAF